MYIRDGSGVGNDIEKRGVYGMENCNVAILSVVMNRSAKPGYFSVHKAFFVSVSWNG